MSRNKQIDEMARAMCLQREHCTANSCTGVNCETTWLAENLYNAGYRKASDIFEELKQILKDEIGKENELECTAWEECDMKAHSVHLYAGDMLDTLMTALIESQKKHESEEK